MTFRSPTDRDRARSAAYRRASAEALTVSVRAASVRRRRREQAQTVLAGLAVLAVIAVVIAGIVLAVKAHSAHTRDCKTNGGRVTSSTSPTVYVSNGKVHQSTDTTYYCVTTDRGIIDVWG